MLIDGKYWKGTVGDLLERIPSLWRLVQVARYQKHPFIRRLVTPGHDLVIEGYPRSANSFATRAFLANNGWREIKLATHTHRAAQVKLATQWKVPTLILIRHPSEAVPSLMALSAEADPARMEQLGEVRERRWIRRLTKQYIYFYDTIFPLSDQFVVTDFAAATTDFSNVIRRLNDRFGTDWAEFDHSEESLARLFATSKRHLFPNAGRTEIKRKFARLYHAAENAELARAAEQCYARFLDLAR